MKIKDLADKGKIEYIDISSVGANSIAFTKENALLIAKVIRQENIPILGGDVYFLNKGQIEAALDNWSCAKTADEPLRDYTERSYKKAMNFITGYGKKGNFRLWDVLLCKIINRSPASNGVPVFEFAISDSKMFDSQKMQIRKRDIPKRVVTKVGNIFCVEIDNEYKCFFQYIANDMTELNSSVIRVFKKHYSMDYIPNMDEIVQDEVYFYAHGILSRGIRAGSWYKVGKNADVGDVNKIMFRDTEDSLSISFCRKSSKWYVWHIGGPTSDIGRLTKETRKIDLGYIWNNTNIIAKIKTGKFLLPEIL